VVEEEKTKEKMHMGVSNRAMKKVVEEKKTSKQLVKN
jgi:hypothetical protein